LYEIAQTFLLCFIPMFVAMDPVGLVPVYLGLTEDLSPSEKRRVTIEACLTGLLVGLGFLALGRTVFRVLGIRMADFLVAGGVVLFCFALNDLLGAGRRWRRSGDSVGAVPLGTPLLVGPGVLAAGLLVLGEHGWAATTAALIACLVGAGVVFLISGWIVRVLRPAGVRAASRIAALLLAAFAVMMVRRGVTEIVQRAVETISAGP